METGPVETGPVGTRPLGTSGSVVTAGETMMLITPAVPGRIRHAAGLVSSVGGAESNVAVGLARLGVEAKWLSALGDDEPGELVLSRLRAEGVDVTDVLRVPGRSTAIYLREQVAGATRVYYYRQGSAASTMSPDTFDPGVLAGARVLHLSGITAALSPECAAFVDWAARQARAAGLRVSYDVNYRSKLWDAAEARAATEAVLPLVDLLLVGHDEAEALWGWDPATCLERFPDLGPAEVVVKQGADGCVADIGGQRHRHEGFRVVEVDPIGAGDAFAAGYLAASVGGAEPEERLRTANAMGAFCVQSHGDYEGLPSRAELNSFINGTKELGR